MFKSEELEKKWQPILESAEAPAFVDNYRKSVTAVLLENQEIAARESAAQANFLSEENQLTGAVAKWDPVLVSLVRRAMPSLVAYDIAGVQPMTGPTGLIFAMKARYAGANESPDTGLIHTNDAEALFDTIDDDFSGQTGDSPDDFGTGIPTGTAEVAEPANMGFTIEKQTVTAATRQLQAEYSMELAQDLKAVHGLDAEAELANILSTEILAEINREVIGKINHEAQKGAAGAGTPGAFDLDADADGRWAVEKFKSLLFQIEIESNEIAKGTRRGKGNYIVASSNVASALAAAGVHGEASVRPLHDSKGAQVASYEAEPSDSAQEDRLLLLLDVPVQHLVPCGVPVPGVRHLFDLHGFLLRLPPPPLPSVCVI